MTQEEKDIQLQEEVMRAFEAIRESRNEYPPTIAGSLNRYPINTDVTLLELEHLLHLAL
jgi:hypothetical protein